jgi:hypothetical protein
MSTLRMPRVLRIKAFTRVRRMMKVQRCFGLSLYKIRFVYSSGISLLGGFLLRERIPRIKSLFGL